jgi:hypothetical protein
LYTEAISKTYNGVNFSVDIDFIPFVPIKHIFWLSVILTSVPKFSAPIVTFMALISKSQNSYYIGFIKIEFNSTVSITGRDIVFGTTIMSVVGSFVEIDGLRA